MLKQQLEPVLHHLWRAAGLTVSRELTDKQLLERYVQSRDGDAFATLVHRHGRLVRSVCLRALRHIEDADDAFQATFLIFATKAPSIRRASSVASWLYGVAYRTAMNAKRLRSRRRETQQGLEACPTERPDLEAGLRELQTILDDEVDRLPEKYRTPFVLCCLEGQSKAEAAAQLGWKEGTVSSRLARARQELKQRLARRGVALAAALCTLELSRIAATAAASPSLVNATIKAGFALAAGKTALADMVSAEVAALTKGALKTMLTTKLKIAMAILLTVGVVAAGVGALAQRDQVPPQAQALRTGPKVPAEATLGQPEALPLDGHKGAVRAIAFAPDGKTVATAGTDKRVRIWDLATGKQTLKLEQPSEAVGVAFSLDGQMLVAASAGKEGALVAWDPATGKELWRMHENGGASGAIAFSPDGKLIAAGFETALGVRGPGFQGGPPDNASLVVAFNAATRQTVFGSLWTKPSSALTFSPDGKYLAVGDDSGPVHLLAVPDPKDGLPFWKGRASVTALAFLPGGTKVAAVNGGKAVRILDATNGGEEAAFAGDEDIQALALSPDGKQLATGGKGGVVRLWDPATGKEARRFEASVAGVSGLAFAPDGQKLATVAEDGTAIVLDLSRDEKPLPRDLKLTEKELAALWEDLASDEGLKAYAALRTLRSDPTHSVPFLRERLKSPVGEVDVKKLQELVADLDADLFETREKAAQELEKLGKVAESALRTALAGEPSLEVKKRAERLLKLLEGEGELTAKQRRDVRGVRVLEQTSTPEARKVLETLVKESSGWWVTQEAKAALERLAPRDKKP